MHLVSSTTYEGVKEALDSLPVMGLFIPSTGKVSFEEFSLVRDGWTTRILAFVFETPGSVPGLSSFSIIGRARPMTVD